MYVSHQAASGSFNKGETLQQQLNDMKLLGSIGIGIYGAKSSKQKLNTRTDAATGFIINTRIELLRPIRFRG